MGAREQLVTEEIVHVQWEGPLTLGQARSRNHRRSDYGLYQVYGRHPSSGADALLYIGATGQATFAETFAPRVPGEQNREPDWEAREADLGPVRVFLGRLAGYATPAFETWNQQMDGVHRLLTRAHQPTHNTPQDIPAAGAPDLAGLHVLNWGSFGTLLPEVSGARWADRFSLAPPEQYGNYVGPGFAPYGGLTVTPDDPGDVGD